MHLPSILSHGVKREPVNNQQKVDHNPGKTGTEYKLQAKVCTESSTLYYEPRSCNSLTCNDVLILTFNVVKSRLSSDMRQHDWFAWIYGAR